MLTSFVFSLLIFSNFNSTVKSRRAELFKQSRGVLNSIEIERELYLSEGRFRNHWSIANWVCFEGTKFVFNCTPSKVFEPGVSNKLAYEKIVGEFEGRTNAYFYGKSPTLYQCEHDSAEVNTLMKDEKVICVSGYPIDETIEKDLNGNQVKIFDWVLKTIKTLKGCKSFKGRDDCQPN